MVFGTFLMMYHFKEHFFEKQTKDLIKTCVTMCQCSKQSLASAIAVFISDIFILLK